MATQQQPTGVPTYQYQQFNGVVYPDAQHLHGQTQSPAPQYYELQQQQQQQPQGQTVIHEIQSEPLNRNSTMPIVVQDAQAQVPHINITPDPPPKAFQNPPQDPSAVKPSPGATMSYEPRLKLPSHVEFHNGMCGCVSDFFHCNNMNTCCCGAWCPCVLYSRIHYRLRAKNPHDLNGFSKCNAQSWNSCCFGATIHARQRDEIRHRYGLPGSCFGDCCRHVFCGPCTLCQEEKELIYREKELEELVKLNTYQNNQTMMYAPMPKQVQVQEKA